jgi:hypothetical protein
LLVLNELKERGNYLTITSMIREISIKHNIPESSLRNYVRKLKEWELVDSDDVVQLTENGDLILKIVGGRNAN